MEYEQIKEFDSILKRLDLTSTQIKLASDFFISKVCNVKNSELIPDLTSSIYIHCFEDLPNCQKYIHLINEIVIKLRKMDINENILLASKGFFEIFNVLSEANISDKNKKEMERILKIWVDKKILNINLLKKTKYKVAENLDFMINSLNNKGFLFLYGNDLIKLDELVLNLKLHLDKVFEQNEDCNCEITNSNKLKLQETICKLQDKLIESYEQDVKTLKDIDGILEKLSEVN